jgi:hypothetical protein
VLNSTVDIEKQKQIVLGEASDFVGQSGETVGIKVELGELTDLLDALRQHGDVRLGKVEPGSTLFPALCKLATQVLEGFKCK